MAVVEHHRDIGLVGFLLAVEQGYSELGFLVGEQEDVLKVFVEWFFVGQLGELHGAVGAVGEVVGAADTGDESLCNGAAQLHLSGYVADVVFAVREAVGDYEDDVAGVVVGGEVVEGVGQGRGGGDASIGD